MRVHAVEVVDSPTRRSHVRLTAVVDSAAATPERYWFEVARSLAPDLDDSGDPWLVASLPLAATLGEPLEVDAPVDPRLLASAGRLLRIWRSWYPDLSAVRIEAEPRRPPPSARAGRTGAFFSGGVDSSFTAKLAIERSPRPGASRLDDLITVAGFDVPLANEAAVERLERMAHDAASRLERESVPVRTNLRDTTWSRADWGRLAHGCGLGAVGLALGKRYDTLLIAATGGYRDLHPWGSHPLTDPLMSTTGTRFLHHGASSTRTDKIRDLLGSPLLESLRVCWESGTERNCGRCRKCVRTMATLELLGALDQAPTFPDGRVDPPRIRRVDCQRAWDAREFRDLRRLAADVGRDDLVRAVDDVLQRWRRRRLGRRVVAPLRRRLGALRRQAGRLAEALGVDVGLPGTGAESDP